MISSYFKIKILAIRNEFVTQGHKGFNALESCAFVLSLLSVYYANCENNANVNEIELNAFPKKANIHVKFSDDS